VGRRCLALAAAAGEREWQSAGCGSGSGLWGSGGSLAIQQAPCRNCVHSRSATETWVTLISWPTRHWSSEASDGDVRGAEVRVVADNGAGR
jgi:hypothetical protein